MLATLPHAVQAAITERGGPQDRVTWCSLRDENLIVPGSDLLLKHGVRIAGEWSMLGILDALPDAAVAGSPELAQMLSAFSLGSLGAVIGPMAPAIRTMLGRPTDAYGMTPLLIFREVSG